MSNTSNLRVVSLCLSSIHRSLCCKLLFRWPFYLFRVTAIALQYLSQLDHFLQKFHRIFGTDYQQVGILLSPKRYPMLPWTESDKSTQGTIWFLQYILVFCSSAYIYFWGCNVKTVIDFVERWDNAFFEINFREFTSSARSQNNV